MNERELILGQLIRSYKVLEQTAKRLGDREKEKHCRESVELFTCQLLGYPQKHIEQNVQMPPSKLLWEPEKECSGTCGDGCKCK